MIKDTVGDDLIQFVKSNFSFLITECGYSMHEYYTTFDRYLARNSYVISYTNQYYEKQFEMALLVRSNVFTTIVRKITNNKPASYIDKDNCILIEYLLLLLDPPVYDFRSFATSDESEKNVIKSEAEFLYRFKPTLCSKEWFDTEKIKVLKNDYYKKTHNIDIAINITENYNIESISDIIKAKLSFLLEKGYSIINDSDDFPLYAVTSWFITYSDNINTIRILRGSMDDWRYFVTINGKKQAIEYKNALLENVPDHIAYIIKEGL